MDDRDLARAVRGFADDDSARLADLPVTRFFTATVSNATAGSLAVTWRGKSVPMAGKAAGYTPAIGQRVLCALVDGQPLIVMWIDGQP